MSNHKYRRYLTAEQFAEIKDAIVEAVRKDNAEAVKAEAAAYVRDHLSPEADKIKMEITAVQQVRDMVVQVMPTLIRDHLNDVVWAMVKNLDKDQRDGLARVIAKQMVSLQADGDYTVFALFQRLAAEAAGQSTAAVRRHVDALIGGDHIANMVRNEIENARTNGAPLPTTNPQVLRAFETSGVQARLEEMVAGLVARYAQQPKAAPTN